MIGEGASEEMFAERQRRRNVARGMQKTKGNVPREMVRE